MATLTDPPAPDSEVRPTLKTIAAATGLAIATVSRALKDAPDIGEDTKRRVRETAALLGYRPNRAGVRLRTGKTNVIALVLSTETDVMNHTSRLIYSIANALRGTAYHLIVTPFFPDQDPMDPIRYIVETESADGIILNQTKEDDPRIRYLHDHGFPFAAHGRSDMGIDHPYFDFDNEAYGRLGARALAERGRRRLLLIAPPRSHMYARHMTVGFSDESALLGLPFEVASDVTSDSAGDAVETAVAARFAQPNPPDGLLLGSTTAAMAAIAGAERSGLVLGRDFDAVAKEAIPILRRFRRDILIVREDVGRAGEFLARALVAEIDKRDWTDRQGLEVPVKVECGR
ncbi:LacI family transcriptional regulator [Rhodobacter calidifons]|uniref:LacI family DNA-binding transcriptional regulator n=1 Tax=Rhodobacter calidifons TaxID=2715277 RepID=A0ABX0G9N1_9RHOB|nr:LacI family transcriptional regulator [Rhodobacter calidifons]NHB77580.1 LacI family DNA-binding transcriptional regulator [Rhodobacter calidifons]